MAWVINTESPKELPGSLPPRELKAANFPGLGLSSSGTRHPLPFFTHFIEEYLPTYFFFFFTSMRKNTGMGGGCSYVIQKYLHLGDNTVKQLNSLLLKT